MSEIGETFAALREERRERRNWAFELHWKQLRASGLKLEVFTVDHVRIKFDGQRIDCWPSSGKWMIVGKNRVYRGFSALFSHLGLKEPNV